MCVCYNLDEAEQAEALQMLSAVLEFEEHLQSSQTDKLSGATDAAGMTATDAGSSEEGPVVHHLHHHHHHHHHHQCSGDSMVARVCQSLAMLHYLLNDKHKVVNDALTQSCIQSCIAFVTVPQTRSVKYNYKCNT